MIEIIKVTKEMFIERMKDCCPNKFSDEALFLLFDWLDDDKNKPEEPEFYLEDIQINIKMWCLMYKESLVADYIVRYPLQEFDELGKDYPIERKIVMTNQLRDRFERHDIVGFTETTIIYCDY